MGTDSIGISETISAARFGQTRRAVLGLFFTRPDESFHLRQVVRLTGAGVGAVQRELARLAGAGILRRTDRANLAIYQADPACPVFGELKSLAVKTLGVGDVLREALVPLAGRIRLAFLFGSFARGEQRQASDVDVLVVSDDLSFGDVVEALHPVRDKLGREVNPTLYRPDEFRDKLATGHYFLTRVVNGPKVFLIGGEGDLAAA